MGPKKKSLNDKRDEAKEREESKKQAAKDKVAQAEESRAVKEEKSEKGKAGIKKEEEERKKAEQAAKRAELKRLQEEEEAALVAKKSKLPTGGSQKVTKYQLEKQKELEEQMKEEQLRERSMMIKREVDEHSYSRTIAHENTNRAVEGVVDARSVDHALAALTIGDAVAEEKHPEKRMKVAWKTFEERQLVELKQDKPGLKMSQYKDLIWKLWQKSPDNPMNQAAAVAAVAGPSRA